MTAQLSLPSIVLNVVQRAARDPIMQRQRWIVAQNGISMLDRMVIEQTDTDSLKQKVEDLLHSFAPASRRALEGNEHLQNLRKRLASGELNSVAHESGTIVLIETLRRVQQRVPLQEIIAHFVAHIIGEMFINADDLPQVYELERELMRVATLMGAMADEANPLNRALKRLKAQVAALTATRKGPPPSSGGARTGFGLRHRPQHQQVREAASLGHQ